MGTRGTLPVHGKEFFVYGGATSCVLLRFGDTNIIMDAGTGLLDAQKLLPYKNYTFSILLSHAHVDHVLGLCNFMPLFDKTAQIDIYGKTRGGLCVEEQVNCIMRQPIWPISTSEYKAKVRFKDVPDEFYINDVKISTFEANHPGGCTAYRLDWGQKSVVYATDYEMTFQNEADFAEFANNCSLLICDGQYLVSELEQNKGYGHSCWRDVARIAKLCHCSKAAVFHHDPSHNDEMLNRLDQSIKTLFDGGFFAKKGMVIEL